MKIRFGRLGLALAFSCLAVPAPLSAQVPKTIRATVLVKVQPEAALFEVQTALDRRKLKIIHTFGQIGWLEARKMDLSAVTPADLQLLSQEAVFSAVEPDQVIEASRLPNDPRFGEQAGLKRLGAEKAWDRTVGDRSVLVAVSDTGIEAAHTDLRSQIWFNPGEVPENGVDDDGNGYVDDSRGWDFKDGDPIPQDGHGHGTHVAGIIGAAGDNAEGITGVNWNVRILPLRFMGDDGSGSNADGIKTILYAADQGARVINLSWGGDGFSDALLDALTYAHDKGMLVVAAAGNDSSDTDAKPHYPSTYDAPTLLSVASSEADGVLSDFSNYGATTVDLVAPGSAILSTYPGGYKKLSGTSMAAPMVSGVAALLLALDGTLDVTTLRNALLNATVARTGYVGKVATGGDLKADLAVEELLDPAFRVWPERMTVAEKGSFRFTARGAHGAVSWSVEPPNAAQITPETGELKASKAASFKVIARDASGGSLAEASVTVVKPSSGGGGGCGKSREPGPVTPYERLGAMLSFGLPFMAGALLKRKKP